MCTILVCWHLLVLGELVNYIEFNILSMRFILFTWKCRRAVRWKQKVFKKNVYISLPIL